jgi:S1-C subfamily serine protease
VARGYLGIRTQLVALPDRLREALALADGQRRALLIAGVENGSPAEQGGLLLGDTLLGIDGRPVQDVDDLRRHLGRPGQVITLRIVRGGEARELTVTLGAEP